MKKILNKKNILIILMFILSVIISATFVFFMDFSLLKELYNLYFGESEVKDFFAEFGDNLFNNASLKSIFRLVLFRFIYSVAPISFGIFLLLFYHSKELSIDILKFDIFKHNPSLSKILQFSRYFLGMCISFLVLNVKRTFFYSVFHNCLLGNTEDFIRVILSVTLFLIPVLNWDVFFKDLKTFPNRHKKITILIFMIFVSVLSFCLIEFQIGSKTSVFVYMIHINIMYFIIYII